MYDILWYIYDKRWYSQVLCRQNVLLTAPQPPQSTHICTPGVARPLQGIPCTSKRVPSLVNPHIQQLWPVEMDACTSSSVASRESSDAQNAGYSALLVLQWIPLGPRLACTPAKKYGELLIYSSSDIVTKCWYAHIHYAFHGMKCCNPVPSFALGAGRNAQPPCRSRHQDKIVVRMTQTTGRDRQTDDRQIYLWLETQTFCGKMCINKRIQLKSRRDLFVHTLSGVDSDPGGGGGGGGCSNITTPSYRYGDSHHKDKAAWWPSHLYNMSCYTWKDSLYIEAGPRLLTQWRACFLWITNVCCNMWGSKSAYSDCGMNHHQLIDQRGHVFPWATTTSATIWLHGQSTTCLKFAARNVTVVSSRALVRIDNYRHIKIPGPGKHVFNQNLMKSDCWYRRKF